MKPRHYHRQILFVILIWMLFGCKSGVEGGAAPSIYISPVDAKIIFDNVPLDGELSKEFIVSNTGKVTLTISKIAISGGGGMFDLAESEGFPIQLPIRIKPNTESFKFKVKFVRSNLDKIDAKLKLECNDPLQALVEKSLEAPEPEAALVILPSKVIFAGVKPGEVDAKAVKVKNVGNAPINLLSIELTGDTSFSLTLDKEISAEDPVALDSTGSNNEYNFKIQFKPETTGGSEGTLIVKYVMANTVGEEPSTATVPVYGNRYNRCISTDPFDELNFDKQPIGNTAKRYVILKSCGTEPIQITAVSIIDNVTNTFILPVPPELPLSLNPNDEYKLEVDYKPTAKVIDTGMLDIVSDAENANPYDLPIRGEGVDLVCPVALIKATPSDQELQPQTTITLSGSESHSSYGNIVNYEWSVEAPQGNVSVFSPGSSGFAQVNFTMNIAGTYVFKLDVWDEAGNKSCEQARYEVAVIPGNALHIELIWNTPGDHNETDECPDCYFTGVYCGSDVDLHLLHPDAIDYFDTMYDCFFQNPITSWGNPSSKDDDARLDRDDVDGGGPENINIDVPEKVAYRVGVHYYCSHQYGSANVTVRIYYYGQLMKEFTRSMSNWQMWDVAAVNYDGVVTPINNVQNNVTGCLW